MNRRDLQALAEIRLGDAEALYGAGRYPGAYYLGGYAVDCGLKAAIAKLTRANDFPELKRTHASHTHDLNALLQLAGLADDLERDLGKSPAFERCWLTLKDWLETSRYRHDTTREMATDLLKSVGHPDNGLLPWIRRCW